MKLKILSVGKVRDKNLAKICQKFTKRINHDIDFEDILIKDSGKQKENLKILKHMKSNDGFHIAMSEDGEHVDSKGLALLLKSRSEKITFIPFGRRLENNPMSFPKLIPPLHGVPIPTKRAVSPLFLDLKSSVII